MVASGQKSRTIPRFNRQDRAMTILRMLPLLITLVVASCASQIMGKYVGQDIREVAISYGPPSNAFDLGDGQRVFQWISTTSITMPSTSTTTGSATVVGNSVWMNSNTHITSPQTITQKDVCSYIATWDTSKSAWIVSEVRIPKGLVASCF